MSSKEYFKKYREEYKEHLKEYYRAWRLAHKEELNSYARKYNSDNKERLSPQKKAHKAKYRSKAETKGKEQVYQKTFNRKPSSRYAYMKYNAKKRKINFNLPLEIYVELLKQPCYACGGPLNHTSTGLDRIDNDKKIGYVEGNVLPCCNQCNRIRNVYLTVEETKAVMTFLKEFRNAKRGH